MRRKLTTTEFITKATQVHGKTYDYGHVDYINSEIKVRIVCGKHGEFWQAPENHLAGNGCPSCKAEAISKKLKSSTAEFISKAVQVHGDTYDYSLVNYTKSSEMVSVICKKHGSFQQRASNHIDGRGCHKCKAEALSNQKRSNTLEFINRAIQVHGNSYDYTSVHYKDSATKVEIICKKHGGFWQKPTHHLDGAGCPTCNESKGEKAISVLLDKLGLVYHRQYTFEQCRGITKHRRLLYFDFFIPQFQCLIEYDGEHHFHSDRRGGIIGFWTTKRNDAIKDEFAKEHGIPLLRVPYYDLDRVEQIVTEWLNSLA